jgi:hypothetical protein
MSGSGQHHGSFSFSSFSGSPQASGTFTLWSAKKFGGKTLITINDENAEAIIVKLSLLFLATLTIAGFFLGSASFSLSILAGGILVLLNHCWLRSILERILSGQTENAARYAVIRFILRLSLISLVVIALFRVGVNIAGLLTGLSILVLAMISVSIYSLVHHKGEPS